jgi:outer membrane protein OmpA-like peptidoglycan-associated protein
MGALSILLLLPTAWAAPFVGVGGLGFVPLTEPYADPGVLLGIYAGAAFPRMGVEGRLDWGPVHGDYDGQVRSLRADGLHFFLPEARFDPLLLYGVGFRTTTPRTSADLHDARALGLTNVPLFLLVGGGVVFHVAGPLYVRADARMRMGDGNVAERKNAFWLPEASLSLELRPVGSPDRDRDSILNRYDTCPDDPEDMDGILDRDGCPEVDVDRDGLADDVDRCPTKRETVNGYEDEDGCPDAVPVAAAALPEPLRRFSGTIPGIVFAFDSAAILPASEPVVEAAATALRAYPDVNLVIRGHTDSIADDAYNLALSEARAQAVAAWLAGHGVDAGRLTAEGFGETRPVDTNDTEEGRARNRRVEFVIVEGAGD